ncbi:endonuclease/exonuclease/phosphatase family protein [Vibrio europaeus]|uniref:endonuclease/exonuclease/phosphatase family protein n=1 Tax=Vibrio europaeus TaxID=300876 RepID=UPI00233EE71A|nr:endonuclease/exonuclease/phosphatase family protein [Vibrio europaeus]MDC5821530.1 endonuclease/exonuclease/phosphatase family protein [Vibrio europaeus]MDC5868528.1 endonuclease/exonuclease/phosphatase family protein [Vibrio europaeus]
MRKILVLLTVIASLFGCKKDPQPNPPLNQTTVKVLTANLWHDLEKGYDVGLAEMKHAQADIILTQESDGVNARLAEDLEMYYWQGREGDASVGIFSRFPIVKVLNGMDEDLDTDRGAQIGAVIDINGHEVVVWNNHLDWKQYTAVEPRGLDGNSSAPHDLCLPNKLTQQELDAYNAHSRRPAQARHQSKVLEQYIANGTPVFVGGDFNEPSGVDWQHNNILFDRTASDYDFSTHRITREAGLLDSFRTLYPDTLSYPGITWPVRNAESWTKSSAVTNGCGRAVDDRDRIDFIYYSDNATGLELDKVAFIGPRYSHFFQPVDGSSTEVYQTLEPHEGRMVNAQGEPEYSENVADFPSDHLWYSATFKLETPYTHSTRKSLDLNPRFENAQLAASGNDLVVGFNIANWVGYESSRKYYLYVTEHTAGPRDHSGGYKAITAKPNEQHPLAITVSNDYLKKVKGSDSKLQLRIYSNIAGSPKIFASKTFSLEEIERIVTIN